MEARFLCLPPKDDLESRISYRELYFCFCTELIPVRGWGWWRDRWPLIGWNESEVRWKIMQRLWRSIGGWYQHLVQYLPFNLCVRLIDPLNSESYGYRSEKRQIIVSSSLCAFMCVCLGRGWGDPSPMATGWTVDPSASSKYLQRAGQ